MLARLVVLVAVLAAVPVAGGAQSLWNKVKEGAASAVEKAEDAVTSTVEMVQDDDTPEATRQRLDAMAEATLARLFEERADAQPLYDRSHGYAVFDTRKLTLTLAAGYGRGVAVDKETGARTYMNMAIAGIGRSFGFGGFESQLIVLFETADAFRRFVEEGIDATAEAGAMFGTDKEEMAARFTNGAAVFVLTKQGWKVAASVTGTKYWKDTDLN